MRYINILFLFVFVATAAANNSDLLDRDFRRLASEETVNLKEDYEGKVILIVGITGRREHAQVVPFAFVGKGAQLLDGPLRDHGDVDLVASVPGGAVQ